MELNLTNEGSNCKFSCDFSKSKLTSGDLKEEMIRNKNALQSTHTFDVSYNRIEELSLADLNILVLLASHNKIKTVELKLTKLIDLDLSFNSLKEIPNLNYLVNLQNLKLNNNFIKKVNFSSFKNNNKLVSLDLSNNQIVFENTKSFFELIEGFSKNSNFKNMSIMNNSFINNRIYQNKYFDYIKFSITSLDQLNNKDVKDKDIKKQKDIIKSLIAEIKNSEEAYMNITSRLGRIADKFEMSSFDDLNFHLTFKELEGDIAEYVKKIGEEILFQGEEFSNEGEFDSLDRLINLCKIANESYPEIDRRLVDLFLPLTIIKKGKYAKPIFNFLKHLADSNEGLQSKLETEIGKLYNPLFKLKNLEEEYSNPYEDLLDKLPMFFKGLILFVNENFPEIVVTCFTQLQYLFVLDPPVFSVSKTNLLLFSNSEKNKISTKESYEKQVKLQLFKSAVKIFRLCLKKSVIKLMYDKTTIIIPTLCESLFEITIKIFSTFVEKGNESKSLLKVLTTLMTILLRIRDLSNIKESTLRRAIDLFIKFITRRISDKYKLIDANGTLLSSQQIKEIVYQNKILQLTFRLFTKLCLCFPNDSERNRTSTIGLINEIYKLENFKSDDEIYSINFKSPVKQDGKPQTKEENLNLSFISNTYNSPTKPNTKRLNFCYDPFLFTIANQIVLCLFENRVFFWGDNTQEYLLYIDHIDHIFEILLSFLNERSPRFILACRIAYIYSNLRDGSDHISTTSASGDYYLTKLAISVINLLDFFGVQAKSENPQIKERFRKLNKSLDKSGRDNLLIKKVSSTNEVIRTKAMKCFLNVEFEEISFDELKHLLKAIDNSWMEGGMEAIIDDTFIYIIKLFHYKFTKKDPILLQATEVISLALKILEKNTERVYYKAHGEELIKELNISTVALVINLSGYNKFSSCFKNEHLSLIKRILTNEFKASKQSFFFPLNIEKCVLMWNVENILSLVTGENGLKPYNYISLRILMHLADVLLNIPFATFELYDTGDTEKKFIIEHLKLLEVDRIKNEEKNLDEFLELKIEEINNLLPCNRENKFIKMNQHAVNAAHLRFVDEFVLFLNWLMEINTNKTDNNYNNYNRNFNTKFDPLIDKFDKSQFSKKESEDISDEIKANPILKTDMKEFLKFVLRSKKLNTVKERIDEKLIYDHITNDIEEKDTYGESVYTLERPKHLESVNNPKLRHLFISAFLRCIIAVLEGKTIDNVKVKVEAKERLLTTLRIPEIFKKFVLLVDTSGLKSYKISTKFLIILNLIFTKFNYELLNDSEGRQTLIMISSIMISKIVIIINSEKFSEKDDIALISALVQCCLTLCSEINLSQIDSDRKKDLIIKIISDDLINCVIGKCCQFISAEESKLLDQNYNFRISYLSSLTNVIRLLGYYMSLNDKNAYHVTEILMKKALVEKTSIRRTFIQETVEMHKIFIMVHITQERHTQINEKILFFSECLFFDHTCKNIETKLLFVTDQNFLLHEYKPKFLERDFDYELINLDKIETDFKLNFKTDLEKVFCSPFVNRIYFKFKNERQFSLLFKNTMRVNILCELITYLNRDINIVNCSDFTLSEHEKSLILNNINEQQLKNESLMNSDKKRIILEKENNFENENDLNSEFVPLTANEHKKQFLKRKEKNKLEKTVEQVDLNSSVGYSNTIDVKESSFLNNTNLSNLSTNRNLVDNNLDLTHQKFRFYEDLFLVSLQQSYLSDYFGVEERYIKNPKIILFKNVLFNKMINEDTMFNPPKLLIYSESFSKIVNVEIKEKFMKSTFDNFAYNDSYKKDYDLLLSNMTNVKFVSPNVIVLEIEGKVFKFSFYDDYSYFSVRSIIVSYAKLKNFKRKGKEESLSLN